MLHSMTRRGFLGFAGVVPFLRVPLSDTRPTDNAVVDVLENFPQHDPSVVREIVQVSHGNLERVRELVAARPALGSASWDWGFGDWETPIDAASHVGNRPIAEFLIANGARPTIYTAAMMGQLPIVTQWIESVPGVQRNRGPHGITLLAHAKFGGAPASHVYDYLQSLGDADPKYTDSPVSDDDAQAIVGEYAFGPGAGDRLVVARTQKGGFTVQHPGTFERALFHQGALVFLPMGAEAVRIRFERDGGERRALIVEDGPLRVRARPS